MKDVRPALRALILSSPTVTAIAGQRVYPNQLPQGERRPSVVYNRVAGTFNYTMQGSGGLIQNLFQIDSIAETPDQADALAIAVHDVLTGFSGDISYGGSPAQTVNFQAILAQNVRDLYDSATQLQRLARDFQVWFRENDLPAVPVAPSWVPSDLGPSLLRQWFPMDQLTGSNGDPQSQLLDKSGNALHTMVQTGIARPTLVVGAKNGLNGLRYDATNQQYHRLDTTIANGMTKGTIVAVMKLDNDPATAGNTTGWCRVGGALQDAFPYVDSNISCGQLSDTRYVSLIASEPRPSLATAYRIVAVHSQTNDWSMFIDGALIHHETTNVFSVGNVNFFTLGGDWQPGIFMRGNFLDWALYATVDTTIRQQFEAYWTNKFALP